MTTMTPIAFYKIDFSKIQIAPKKNLKDSKLKTFTLTYQADDQQKPSELIIQTPQLRSPWGRSDASTLPFNLKEKTLEKDKKVSYDVSLNTMNQKNQAIMDKFTDFLQKFNDFIIDYVYDHISDLYPVKMQKIFNNNKALLREIGYSSFIKINEKPDGKVYKNFKIKLPIYEGVPMFKVYLADSTTAVNLAKDNGLSAPKGPDDKTVPEINWEWDRPNIEFVSILKCDGIIVFPSGDKVGCSWSAKALKIAPPSAMTITSKSFITDPDLEPDIEPETKSETKSEKKPEKKLEKKSTKSDVKSDTKSETASDIDETLLEIDANRIEPENEIEEIRDDENN